MIGGRLHYAGLGPSETPAHHLVAMRGWGRRLAERGWCLRSGARDGGDSAFEAGAIESGGDTQVFLPWAGFNGHLTGIEVERFASYGRACRLAKQHHPGWMRLGHGARALLAPNCHLVLGRDLKSPVDFVLCWAPIPSTPQTGA